MHTEQWSLVVAFLALIAAGWASVATWGQLDVARRVHREQNEPYVIVNIEPTAPGSFLMAVVIQNIGPTMARNVKIAVSPPLQSSLGDEFSTQIATAVARTIPMIPPGRRITYAFDTPKRFGSGLPMVFDFTVTSDGPAGEVEPLVYTVDMGVMTEELVGERPTKKLEERVEKVAKGLDRLAKAYETANDDAISDVHRRHYQAVQRRARARQAASARNSSGAP